MSDRVIVVTPWHNHDQRDRFCSAWHIDPDNLPNHVVLQQDTDRSGCGTTKNRGIDEAVRRGAEIVVVLDDDCLPCDPRTEGSRMSLLGLCEAHAEALRPQPVKLFEAVTEPPSRGTPYRTLTVEMPVAASMGFWSEIGDYCAVRQLAHAGTPMTFRREPIHGRYFPLCGMNLAFRPAEWSPWCRFIDVPRFDDIWMGWLWQREAYRRGYCFNLTGPIVRHSRQSNIWSNLENEVRYLEKNETLWVEIATSSYTEYEELRQLLPV